MFSSSLVYCIFVNNALLNEQKLQIRMLGDDLFNAHLQTGKTRGIHEASKNIIIISLDLNKDD